jgi:hypothetical protein
MGDRYFLTSNGGVARERTTPSAVELSVYNRRLRRFVLAPEILGHISGIGGDGDWDRITRDDAARIIAKLNGEPEA